MIRRQHRGNPVFALLAQPENLIAILRVRGAGSHRLEQLATKLLLHRVQLRLGFLRDKIHRVAALGLGLRPRVGAWAVDCRDALRAKQLVQHPVLFLIQLRQLTSGASAGLRQRGGVSGLPVVLSRRGTVEHLGLALVIKLVEILLHEIANRLLGTADASQVLDVRLVVV